MADGSFSGIAQAEDAVAIKSRGGKHRGPRFTWNPAYEQTFFRSLCDSVELGLREGSTLKAEAWERATKALNEAHNAFPLKSHLINKSDNARKKFRLWRSLREDPEFAYNPATRMVTATDDAWKRHIEKEPLSRSLRGRPFDYEDLYEIIYPDVIGSGGAPKRVVKRKEPSSVGVDVDEQATSGTAVISLLADATYGDAPAASVPVPGATALPPSSTTTQTRPSSTTIPPRISISSTSALTPPEETAPHTRNKRFLPADNHPSASGISGGGAAPDKRRRIDLPLPAHDGVLALAEALKAARARPAWPEQALDLFFRDFGEEDMDLQLKIAEKALTDENKAMVFCKMPVALREHWVKRLREVHNRNA